jgi:hypothetical protein
MRVSSTGHSLNQGDEAFIILRRLSFIKMSRQDSQQIFTYPLSPHHWSSKPSFEFMFPTWGLIHDSDFHHTLSVLSHPYHAHANALAHKALCSMWVRTHNECPASV